MNFIEKHTRVLQVLCAALVYIVSFQFCPWEWWAVIILGTVCGTLLSFGEGLEKGIEIVKTSYREVYGRDL